MRQRGESSHDAPGLEPAGDVRVLWGECVPLQAGELPFAPLIAELGRSALVERVEPARLTREQSAAQVAVILGEPAPALADSIYERAEGNPYFTEELLAAGDELPATLRATLDSRLATLPEPARRLLELIAVAGHEVDHDVLTRGARAAAGHRAPLRRAAQRDSEQGHRGARDRPVGGRRRRGGQGQRVPRHDLCLRR